LNFVVIILFFLFLYSTSSIITPFSFLVSSTTTSFSATNSLIFSTISLIFTHSLNFSSNHKVLNNFSTATLLSLPNQKSLDSIFQFFSQLSSSKKFPQLYSRVSCSSKYFLIASIFAFKKDFFSFSVHSNPLFNTSESTSLPAKDGAPSSLLSSRVMNRFL